ncbi:C10 family peptidase, partial [Porphyromonas loveana]|uniref:C10 family peptidase n=1 Tax=Porphyromonas loveana TaxID=1884669 RepID=UPI0035A10E61
FHEINQAVILEKEVLLNVKWGQRAPFNLHAEVMNNGERAPAGCVAIAVGQITTYHKYPKVLEGKTLNWNIQDLVMHGLLMAT